MVLGALLDIGLPIAELRKALGSLALNADAVSTERVLRSGVSATKFRFQEPATITMITSTHTITITHMITNRTTAIPRAERRPAVITA
jgi:uncharacterized protein (DUF111 family)